MNYARRKLDELAESRAERIAALNLMEDAIAARGELERANAALGESEARLRSLLNAMDEAFVVKEKITDSRGRIVDWKYVEWNPAFIRHTGIADPENKTVRQVTPDIEPVWIERYAKVLRTGQSVRFQDRIASRDRWLDVFASRVGGPESRRVALVFTDITEKRRAEEALRANEEQFRRAIEEAPIPVIMHAEDGHVLQISRTWTELTGYKHEDIPTFEAWLNKAYGPGADKVRQHMRKIFRGHARELSIEIDVTTRNGEPRRWSFSASEPGTLRDGRRYIVAMALDVTERAEELREANKGLRELSKRLVEAQEMERRKIAETLHDDIGQVLTALNLVLKRARKVSSITELRDAELLVASLLERVRNLSQNLRPHVLDNLGLAVALRWHVKTFVEQTKIRVALSTRNLPRDLPADVVTTVFRLVQEALTNVARHSGAKRARVSVALRENCLRVEVHDDGRGFRPSKLPVGSSGLANMRERVRLSGGEFEINSSSAGGTTLRATLPVARKSDRKKSSLPLASARRGAQVISAFTPAQPKP